MIAVRQGPDLAALEAETARLMAAFAEAGAAPVSAPALLPAERLLDLYGEDIRARAYVVREGLSEMMMRPDFTLPVVEAHMAGGASPARYAYAGPVWRRQAPGSLRAREHVQAGFELLGDADAAAADAEVFALISAVLEGLPAVVSTGDTGILRAVVTGLSTSQARKAALMRHIWRPARFAALVARYAAPAAARADLVAAARAGRAEEMIDAAGKPVGLRSRDEILARIQRLVEDADTPPLAGDEVALLSRVQALSGNVAEMVGTLQALAGDAPHLAPCAETFEARAEALSLRGVDVGALAFEGTYGRTTLEYYDGFVFGFADAAAPDEKILASGGRYDALTQALGRGQGIPAVGAIVRPEAVLEARGC